MKSFSHLWEKFISKENFELAYQHSILHKSNQKQVQKFKENKEENLERIRQMCIQGKFHTSKYTPKTIYEPKERIIYKLPYCPDRIVQHAIMNILKPILVNKLIPTTYACIEGRGQLKASQKCSEYVRRNTYCLKCDIRKFYPSINQQILSNKFHQIIKDNRFLNILDDIIFSFPGGHNAPIGNYLSQWFGNFYLSKLDNFVKHSLKCKDYERYCDDFLLFSNDKDYLKNCKNKIEKFINEELDLKFSKADIFNVKQGVDFCGYRSFGIYVLVRKSTAKRIIKRFKKISNTEISDKNRLHCLSQVASANGWLKHACSHNLKIKIEFEKILEKLV